MINTEQRSGLPLGLLVVAAMATGGYFLVSSPLESTRHEDRLPVDPVADEGETVPVRSWQDPVMAVHRDYHGLLDYIIENDGTPPGIDKPQDLEAFARRWKGELLYERLRGTGNNAQPIIIGILTPGGPFAEDAEVRRRQRHALTTALAQQAGLPETPEHIGYFLLPRTDTDPAMPYSDGDVDDDDGEDDRDSTPPSPILVPYEWFRFDKRGMGSELLVLWLSNIDFNRYTLNRFSELVGDLLGVPGDWEEGLPRAVLVGPDNSGDLSRMLADGTVTMSGRHQGRFKLEDFVPTSGSDDLTETPEDVSNARAFVAFVGSRRDVYEDVIARMTSIVHEYLDAGLDDEAKDKLGPCFDKALLETLENPATKLQVEIKGCLDGDSTAGIEDSDENWRATVLDDLLRYATFYVVANDHVVPNKTDADSQGSDANLGRTKLLFGALSMAQDYLDFGLNRPRQHVANLYACTAAPLANEEPPECGKLNESISDSDERWSRVVREAYQRTFAEQVDAQRPVVEGQPQQNRPSSPAEQPASQAAAQSPWRLSIEIVSPRASIPPRYLSDEPALKDMKRPADVDGALVELLKIKSFQGVIARDDAVILTIFEELRMRGMRPCKDGNDAIAVLHELDSRYGQMLESVTHDIAEKLWAQEGEPCKPTIVPYAYLRGVDGEMPPPRMHTRSKGARADTERASDSKDKGDMTVSLVHAESAAGAAQLDYVRRLADRIAEGWLNDERTAARTYRAVGVLGADVYDKQLILHALRERLPGVLLFTTDLDARLFSKISHRWTQNLLVGSSYGLRLPDYRPDKCPGVQRRIILPPPFRDSYQTAFYRSIRHIVCPEPSGTLPVPSPRLFEIGRTGPIDITLPRETLIANSGRGLRDALPSLEGENVHGQIGWTVGAGDSVQRAIEVLLLMLPLLILTISNLTFWLRNRFADQSCTVQAHGVAAVVSSSILLTQVIALTMWRNPAAEPLRLFEGISAVPTMALQFSALAFSVCLVLIAWGRICEAETRISRDFFGDDLVRPASVDARLPTPLKQLMLYFTPVTLGRMSLKRDENGEVDCQQLWSSYLAIGSGVSRLVRAALLALLALAVISTLLQPETLFRGPRFLPEAVRYGSAYFSLTLLFFCTDAFKLSQFLLNHVRAANVVGVCTHLGRTPRDNAASSTAKSAGERPRDIYWSSSRAFAGLDDGIKEQTRKFEFVLEYTRWVTPLLAYPAVVLALLLISRSTIFDGWTWSPAIIVIYALALAYLLIRGYLYQKSAENARDAILFYLKVARAELIADKNEVDAEITEATINEISSPRRGAFVPWTRHPILQSIALPSGGLGVLALIEAIF